MKIRNSYYSLFTKTEYQNTSCLGTVHQRCKWASGKALGGSSVTNGMLYVIGNEKDYNDWEESGNDGWGFASVLPYFAKSTNCSASYVSRYGTKYCGDNGPVRIGHFEAASPGVQKILMDGVREAGHDVLEVVNGDRFVGFGRAMGTVHDGRRENAAMAFLSPAKGRKNLSVMKSSAVEKVLFEEGRAIGVRVRSEQKGFVAEVRARKEVILSAGSIATPQLLMLSGIGPREHLEKMGIPVVADRPVGKNLQDHLAWTGMYITYANESSISSPSLNRSLSSIYEYMMENRGPLRAYRTDFLGTVNVNDPNSSYPDVQFLFVPFERHERVQLSVFLETIGLREEIGGKLVEEIERTSVIVVLSILLKPRSRGMVELRSTDPTDPVKIYANYLVEAEDTRTLVKSVDKMKEILDTDALTGNGMRFNRLDVPGCRRFEPDTEQYWECSVRHVSVSYYHSCGTSRMGPGNDTRAVVDPRLRVHGVDGLRVIDGSIIPEIPAANPNAATMMIAEKGADMVKRDWGVKARWLNALSFDYIYMRVTR